MHAKKPTHLFIYDIKFCKYDSSNWNRWFPLTRLHCREGTSKQFVKYIRKWNHSHLSGPAGVLWFRCWIYGCLNTFLVSLMHQSPSVWLCVPFTRSDQVQRCVTFFRLMWLLRVNIILWPHRGYFKEKNKCNWINKRW